MKKNARCKNDNYENINNTKNVKNLLYLLKCCDYFRTFWVWMHMRFFYSMFFFVWFIENLKNDEIHTSSLKNILFSLFIPSTHTHRHFHSNKNPSLQHVHAMINVHERTAHKCASCIVFMNDVILISIFDMVIRLFIKRDTHIYVI